MSKYYQVAELIEGEPMRPTCYICKTREEAEASIARILAGEPSLILTVISVYKVGKD